MIEVQCMHIHKRHRWIAKEEVLAICFFGQLDGHILLVMIRCVCQLTTISGSNFNRTRHVLITLIVVVIFGIWFRQTNGQLFSFFVTKTINHISFADIEGLY